MPVLVVVVARVHAQLVELEVLELLVDPVAAPRQNALDELVLLPRINRIAILFTLLAAAAATARQLLLVGHQYPALIIVKLDHCWAVVAASDRGQGAVLEPWTVLGGRQCVRLSLCARSEKVVEDAWREWISN